jgi:hypothetical protein
MANVNEGTYRAIVVAVGMGLSEQEGHPFVALMCEITRGEYEHRRVAFRGYLHEEESAKRTIGALRAAGWKGQEFPASNALEAWTGLGSEEVEIVVSVEPGRDDPSKTYARVAFVNRLAELRIKRPIDDPRAISGLSRKCQGLLLGERRPSTLPPPAPPARGGQHAPAPHTNGGGYPPADGFGDEIPF